MHFMQGFNHGENLVATSVMVSRICLPGGDRLGATMVVPVALVDTSLLCIEHIDARIFT